MRFLRSDNARFYEGLLNKKQGPLMWVSGCQRMEGHEDPVVMSSTSLLA